MKSEEEEENTAFRASREQKSWRLCKKSHCAVVDLNNWVANCLAGSFPWPLQFSDSARSVAESPVFPDPDEETLDRCSPTMLRGIPGRTWAPQSPVAWVVQVSPSKCLWCGWLAKPESWLLQVFGFRTHQLLFSCFSNWTNYKHVL